MLVIDAAREANKMRTANLLLGELGQMFRYAAAREWIQEIRPLQSPAKTLAARTKRPSA